MTTALLGGQEVHIDDEGFMMDPAEWSDDLAEVLAKQIDIALTDDHWTVLRFLREDFENEGETASLRRISTQIGVSTKELFGLFPKKPGKKMAYVAGLPKPRGCI